VIYTSGSTGKPKGVAIGHEALDRLLRSMGEHPGLARDDVWLSVTSLSFDISALELYLPLITGARVEIARPDTVTDAGQLADLVERSGASVLQATPAGWQALLDAGWTGRENLTALCGGESLSPDLAAALLARGVALWNMYGPTESTIWSSVARVDDTQAITLGQPVHDTTFQIRDEVGQVVPVGGIGELTIGAASLARGYLARPGLTAERFVPNPSAAAEGAATGERLYRTGDLCRQRADGTMEFLGRLDQQIKLRGFRIELGEIEAALRGCPGVREAVAALRGTGESRRLIGYVVGEANEAEIKPALERILPGYMVPVAILRLAALPLTPNGKIDRKALPDPVRTIESPAMSPRTPLEEVIARTWSDVLGVTPVGVTDDFFVLGGNSLSAVRAAFRLSEELGHKVAVRSLFDHPTVEAMARHVETQLASEDQPPAVALDELLEGLV
jgi:acyl-coenzyme A synthetase/AMP-(fatty) acid ligase